MTGKRSGRKSGAPTSSRVFNAFASYFINVISNRLSRGSSRLYLQLYGVGIIEWRTLAWLGDHRQASVMEISQALGMDKAAISRSVTALVAKTLVRSEPVNKRQNLLVLTAEGQSLYEKILPFAVARQRVLLKKLTPDENRLLVGLLQKVGDSLDDLVQFDALLLAQSTANASERRRSAEPLHNIGRAKRSVPRAAP